LLDALPCGVDNLTGYSGVGDRYGDPLVFGLDGSPGLSAVHPSVLGSLGDLLGLRLEPVKPPDAIAL
jgi:hypothetical protein